MNTLLILGFGYTAQALANVLPRDNWRIIGTTRSAEKAAVLAREYDVEILQFPLPDEVDLQAKLLHVTHLLITAGTGEQGDPFLPFIIENLKEFTALQWLGYCSTIGVYAETSGNWVDETSPIHASTPRIAARLQAEAAWQNFTLHRGLNGAAIFRLGGIYGDGRNVFEAIRNGTAQRIIKPGQYFNRIHVADIAGVLAAAIAQPHINGIFNVVDNCPAAQADVVAYAAQLLGVESPPEVQFENAELSPMAQEFYSRNKRVRNTKLRDVLGYQLQFPSYREGLASCNHFSG